LVPHSRPVSPLPDDILIFAIIMSRNLYATDNLVFLGYLDWSIILVSGGTDYREKLRDPHLDLVYCALHMSTKCSKCSFFDTKISISLSLSFSLFFSSITSLIKWGRENRYFARYIPSFRILTYRIRLILSESTKFIDNQIYNITIQKS